MSAQQFPSSPSPSPTLFTSTSLPILCLIDWHSPKCREQHYQIPAPKFASAQFLPLSESNEDDNDYLNKENGFFTPIISKSLNWEAQRITSTIATTSPTSPPTFQTSPPTKPTSVYSTKSFSSPSTSTITSTTTARKRPHSWTRPKTKLEHFTFAPTPKPSTSTTTRKTLAPRFPVDPNDPTLYAVRPTTPMNGASQYGNTPTVC
ncbi:unnamed protein product [Meloidogyne enterolobii]|uniref:Uncharacterized protein n=1 Tax=Meloidogyne enterolobii TaxID=390850 RepID=A0ACB0ZAK0_MELEN